ncbi:MAG: hypothetical protein ACI8PB_002906 [Desulforhopalus sp.]|jgi:hypothetical protein
MSEFTTLRINRAEPEPEDLDDGDGFGPGFDNDWLHITQAPYEKPSMMGSGFTDWLNANSYGLDLGSVFERAAQYQSACEDDGSCTVELQIRKSRSDLGYTLKATYGELSPKMSHSANRQTSVVVSQTKELDLETNISGSVTAAWDERVEVIGFDGSVLMPPPAITQEGSLLTWDVEVYAGSIRLSYTESYDVYTLTISPREPGEYESDDPEGAYQSTVFAVWGGGVETLEIDLPEMEGNCSGGGIVLVNPDDPDGDDEKCYRHNILVDPCTREIIKEWDEEIACPQASPLTPEQEMEIAANENS